MFVVYPNLGDEKALVVRSKDYISEVASPILRRKMTTDSLLDENSPAFTMKGVSSTRRSALVHRKRCPEADQISC